MNLVLSLLISLIIILHAYFIWLEMFAWTTHGKKVFLGLPDSFFEQTKAMAANQGLYNGFLVAGLLWSFMIEDMQWSENVALFFLGCIAVAGIYGAMTAEKRIFYIQGLPAIIAIIILLTN
jgi:putative membrane protein